MTPDEVGRFIDTLERELPSRRNDAIDETGRGERILLWSVALEGANYMAAMKKLPQLLQKWQYFPRLAEVTAELVRDETDPLQQLEYRTMFIRDGDGNAIRGEDGRPVLNTPENRKLLDGPKLRIAE